MLLPEIYATDVCPCRQSLYGVVGGNSRLLCLTGILESLSEMVVLTIQHRDAVVEVYLIFCIVFSNSHLYTFLVFTDSRVELSLTPVSDAQRAMQVHYGLGVTNLISKAQCLSTRSDSISRAPHVLKGNSLLTHKPATGGVCASYGKRTVSKQQGRLLIAAGIIVPNLFEQSVCFVCSSILFLPAARNQ